VGVSDFVLALEMKDVDRFASIFEVLVIYSALVGIELAIVVKNEELGSGFGRWKGGLRKNLQTGRISTGTSSSMLTYVDSRHCFRSEQSGARQNYTTGSHDELLVVSPSPSKDGLQLPIPTLWLAVARIRIDFNRTIGPDLEDDFVIILDIIRDRHNRD
jgi:hypothetical protein